MFQNVDLKDSGPDVSTINNNYNKGKSEIFSSIIGQVLNKKNIILYIISFMISMISFGDGITPFSMAIFGAACANSIPVAIVYIITMIGTFIKFGGSGVLNYLLISLLFIAFVLIFKPWYEEEYKNERRKLGKYIFLATFIIQTIELFFSGFLIYNFLIVIAGSIATYVFYKIFAESLTVIYDWEEKEAFSIEEVIGAILMISIALLAIGDFTIFGLNIAQVVMIIMILVLGWKHGIMVGSTVGITIGAVIGIIGNTNPIIIASFALSGMIAGILNRFGKIGVIIGFMVGNAILTYIYNGNTVAIIYFKEILVASLALILVPNNIKINIEDLFDKKEALPDGTIYRLEDGKIASDKLNGVSDLLHEISNKYIDKEGNSHKELFLDELDSRLKDKEDNILYEDIYNFENGIVDETFELLTKKSKITNMDLQDIFEKHNSVIVTLDNENEIEDIEEQETEITEIINEAYRISNQNYVWNKKITESKRVMSNQLENVSEAISEIAKDMNNNEENFDKEVTKIKLLSEKKNIKILELKIKKIEGKYIINLCTDMCKDDCYTDNIEEILSEVLKSKMVLQNKECAIDRNSNLCKQTYTTKDNYILRIGIAKRTKDKSITTGDSYIKTKLNDGKMLIALSDGMGSGSKAREASQVATKMLKRLLKNGFEKDTSIRLINNTMCLNSKDDMYATLDISVIDLFSGNMEIVKNGACPTYIKRGKDIELIKSFSLPAGILENIDLVTYEKNLKNEDIIVMCTDGIVDSNTEYNDKEVWVKDVLSRIETTDVKRIADILLQEAVDNYVGKPKDDMTVITMKIIKEK